MKWLGVDVGGKRKGFDVAVLDRAGNVSLHGGLICPDVIEIVRQVQPSVVAIDSPRSCAATGQKTRPCERQIARDICGIRWTPDAAAVRGNAYYAWIVEGLSLYEALKACDADAIEVFPTASWTRWLGKRGSRTRASWTRNGLTALGLRGVPNRTTQDQRDAVAAALTARQHSGHATQTIGEIVVPSPSY